MKMPADYGMSGVVLWSSSNSLDNEYNCMATAQYVNRILGPYAQLVMKLAQVCSEHLCNGRCVEPEPDEECFLCSGRCQLKQRTWQCDLIQPLSAYKCKCLRPYTGAHCERVLT